MRTGRQQHRFWARASVGSSSSCQKRAAVGTIIAGWIANRYTMLGDVGKDTSTRANRST